MQQTPLAGPDGRPAIDATTGMPLTMEELLRRRGIVYSNSPMVQLPLGPGTSGATSDPSAAATAAPVAPSGTAPTGPAAAGTTSAQASGTALGGAGTVDPSAPVDVTPEQATQFEQVDQLTGGDSEGYLAELVAMGLLGAGTIAAYRMWRNYRASRPYGMQQAPEPPVVQTVEGPDPTPPRTPPTVDGEFREVHSLPNSTRALPAPEPALGGPETARALADMYSRSRRGMARQRQQRAARGQPNDVGTINQGRVVDTTRPPNYRNPDNSGVQRQLESVRNQIIQLLEGNPGAARALRRGGR